MITFKSKHIDVFRTDDAHLIEFKRNDPYWFPASVLKCSVHEKIKTPLGHKKIWMCELKESFVKDLPGLLPLLLEKKMIFDVKYNQE